MYVSEFEQQISIVSIRNHKQNITEICFIFSHLILIRLIRSWMIVCIFLLRSMKINFLRLFFKNIFCLYLWMSVSLLAVKLTIDLDDHKIEIDLKKKQFKASVSLFNVVVIIHGTIIYRLSSILNECKYSNYHWKK